MCNSKRFFTIVLIVLALVSLGLFIGSSFMTKTEEVVYDVTYEPWIYVIGEQPIINLSDKTITIEINDTQRGQTGFVYKKLHTNKVSVIKNHAYPVGSFLCTIGSNNVNFTYSRDYIGGENCRTFGKKVNNIMIVKDENGNDFDLAKTQYSVAGELVPINDHLNTVGIISIVCFVLSIIGLVYCCCCRFGAVVRPEDEVKGAEV